MADMTDLVKRLRAYATERYLGARCPNLVHEAADAIEKLEAERDEWESAAKTIARSVEAQQRIRAEKAEADLAAARASLIKAGCSDYFCDEAKRECTKCPAYMALAAIAAAQRGRNDHTD